MEEQFYLLMPLLIAVLGVKRLVILICILVVTVALARCYVEDNIGSYVSTHLRLDALLIGVLISILYRCEKFVERIKKYNILVIILFVCSFIVTLLSYKFANLGAHKYTCFMVTYSLAFIVILNNRNTMMLAPLRAEVLSFFSRISYCLYLVHQPIIGLTFLMCADSAKPYRNLLFDFSSSSGVYNYCCRILLQHRETNDS